MTIGIPKALLYYRYGTLWETFFKNLGCGTVTSGETNHAIFENGTRDSVAECCLPSKIYMGHVRELLGKCDYILTPCFERKSDKEKTCIRFYGLCDVIKNTYKNLPALEYIVRKTKPEYREFYALGKRLGKKSREIRAAYIAAVNAQEFNDVCAVNEQAALFNKTGVKILIAAQGYLIYDLYIGRPIIQTVEELGAVPIFSDKLDRDLCRQSAKKIAPRLYWETNMEVIGAIAAYGKVVDGVILLTAFPCGPDSLACEMALRKVKDVPITQIVLDGLMGDAGIRTRIESFIDVINERREK